MRHFKRTDYVIQESAMAQSRTAGTVPFATYVKRIPYVSAGACVDLVMIIKDWLTAS